MSDVFISWGGAADRATVGELASRLIDAGLSVFEYTRSMDPGDVIDIRVMQEIDSAKVAIVCVSDTSIPREWVQNEIAWLHHARHNASLRAIIPVQTGALDAAKIPRLLANTDVYHFEPNAPNSREAALEALVRAIFKGLSRPTPIPFPVVVLAMNASQFATLGGVMPQAQAAVCAHLSVAANAFPAGFAQRYGVDALDFRPFGPDLPLVQVVTTAIREVNRARPSTEPALVLEWLNADLWSVDPNRQLRAGGLLRSNSRLLIIDALSTHHQQVQQMLNDLPDLAPDRTALVWVPPYSHWTRDVQNQILKATVSPARIRYFFEDWLRCGWGRDPAAWLAFDIGTPASLWHWVYWMSNALAETRPQQPRVNQMQSQFPAPGFNPQQATG